MFGLTVSEAAAICGGPVYRLQEEPDCSDTEITGIAIDSRSVAPGNLFVAYRGEKTDGHLYIAAALQKGAACALAEYVPEGVAGPVIVCEDVQASLEKLMAAFREKVSVPVIGITGSVGKTTGKEMVSAVLSQHFRVHKTAGNQNNTIGLPVSLGGISREDEIAVLELGINHFGEMDHLGAMAKPDLMLYTRIAHAHLEFLRDLNGVFRAKTEVLAHMKPEAPILYNGDDPYLASLGERENSMSFGRGEHCDVRAENITVRPGGTVSCKISWKGRTIQAEIPAFGEHMVYAALEGAAVGFCLGLSDEEITAGIASYQTVGRRFSCCDTGSVLLIDDCYNANPDSVISSVNTLMDLPGRHVCILGEMLELGEESARMHREIGAYIRSKGVDLLAVSGEMCRYMVQGFGEDAVFFPDKASLTAALPGLLQRGDAVLVKASLGAAYAEVSDFLKSLVL
ncbi:MAG: UDP-N-acetylmuramoyl-tripeptide--D-alanyl-D-alanine ligase [Oscillospiraceae bacterium]|nr:UDP-N-acetylmuramoyl-tripeptide--D-alanyl-D-alanine ligase [Oscillospiraceae bacterium]